MNAAALCSVAEADDDRALFEVASRLGLDLVAQHAVATTVESCTGGLIARALTETAGSSAWFGQGFVTYSNEAKHSLVGVSRSVLEAHGAVSEPVARAMALGALAALPTSGGRLALSVTGIAGPGGGSATKPVGTVCFGWAWAADGVPATAARVLVETWRLDGDRAQVRRQTALHALRRGHQILLAEPKD